MMSQSEAKQTLSLASLPDLSKTISEFIEKLGDRKKYQYTEAERKRAAKLFDQLLDYKAICDPLAKTFIDICYDLAARLQDSGQDKKCLEACNAILDVCQRQKQEESYVMMGRMNAIYLRSICRDKLGDLDGAISDCKEAIALKDNTKLSADIDPSVHLDKLIQIQQIVRLKPAAASMPVETKDSQYQLLAPSITHLNAIKKQIDETQNFDDKKEEIEKTLKIVIEILSTNPTLSVDQLETVIGVLHSYAELFCIYKQEQKAIELCCAPALVECKKLEKLNEFKKHKWELKINDCEYRVYADQGKYDKAIQASMCQLRSWKALAKLDKDKAAKYEAHAENVSKRIKEKLQAKIAKSKEVKSESASVTVSDKKEQEINERATLILKDIDPALLSDCIPSSPNFHFYECIINYRQGKYNAGCADFVKAVAATLKKNINLKLMPVYELALGSFVGCEHRLYQKMGASHPLYNHISQGVDYYYFVRRAGLEYDDSQRKRAKEDIDIAIWLCQIRLLKLDQALTVKGDSAALLAEKAKLSRDLLAFNEIKKIYNPEYAAECIKQKEEEAKKIAEEKQKSEAILAAQKAKQEAEEKAAKETAEKAAREEAERVAKSAADKAAADKAREERLEAERKKVAAERAERDKAKKQEKHKQKVKKLLGMLAYSLRAYSIIKTKLKAHRVAEAKQRAAEEKLRNEGQERALQQKKLYLKKIDQRRNRAIEHKHLALAKRREATRAQLNSAIKILLSINRLQTKAKKNLKEKAAKKVALAQELKRVAGHSFVNKAKSELKQHDGENKAQELLERKARADRVIVATKQFMTAKNVFLIVNKLKTKLRRKKQKKAAIKQLMVTTKVILAVSKLNKKVKAKRLAKEAPVRELSARIRASLVSEQQKLHTLLGISPLATPTDVSERKSERKEGSAVSSPLLYSPDFSKSVKLLPAKILPMTHIKGLRIPRNEITDRYLSQIENELAVLEAVGARLAFGVGGFARDPLQERSFIKVKKDGITQYIDVDIVFDGGRKELEAAYSKDDGYNITETKLAGGGVLYTVYQNSVSGVTIHRQIFKSPYFEKVLTPSGWEYRFSDPLKADALSRDQYKNAVYFDKLGRVYMPLKETYDAIFQKQISLIDQREIKIATGESFDSKMHYELLSIDDDPKRLLRVLVDAATNPEDQLMVQNIQNALPLLLRTSKGVPRSEAEIISLNSYLLEKFVLSKDAIAIFDMLEKHKVIQEFFPKLPKLTELFKKDVELFLKLRELLTREMTLEEFFANIIILENFPHFASLSMDIIRSDDLLLNEFAPFIQANRLFNVCFGSYHERMIKQHNQRTENIIQTDPSRPLKAPFSLCKILRKAIRFSCAPTPAHLIPNFIDEPTVVKGMTYFPSKKSSVSAAPSATHGEHKHTEQSVMVGHAQSVGTMSAVQSSIAMPATAPVYFSHSAPMHSTVPLSLVPSGYLVPIPVGYTIIQQPLPLAIPQPPQTQAHSHVHSFGGGSSFAASSPGRGGHFAHRGGGRGQDVHPPTRGGHHAPGFGNGKI